MINSDIVQKLWSLCDILRDDGINYSDYVTELVQLLFIKMEHEQVQNNENFSHKLPIGNRWKDLTEKSDQDLIEFYKKMLLDLGNSSDELIATIYCSAQTRLKEPHHLKHLIKAFDSIDWFSARQDGLGDLYEGILEKNANEIKSGAGQYFTPRPLIDCIINCLKPQPGETVQDPTAGTGGFLIAADTYIKKNTSNLQKLKAKERDFQSKRAFIGIELVPGTRRLALMNCLLHGMDGGIGGVVQLGNALGSVGAELPKVDIILSNPPFGTAKGGGGPTRKDLPFHTTNKQLAFLQHIYLGLNPGGRAGVVLPDNVLFESGVGTDIRRDLMEKCDLHTILRLPTGIFYAQGVKTNVLFFQKKSAKKSGPGTKRVWIYDLRTNMPSFGKKTKFDSHYLKKFEDAYGLDPNGKSPRAENIEGIGESSRFRSFSREDIRNAGDSLDITWLKDSSSIDSSELSSPSVLANEAMIELTGALVEMQNLLEMLSTLDTAKPNKTVLAQKMKTDDQTSRIDD